MSSPGNRGVVNVRRAPPTVKRRYPSRSSTSPDARLDSGHRTFTLSAMSKFALILCLAVVSSCRASADDMISVLRRVVGDEHPTKIIPSSLPSRFFALSQKSYWIPRGADSTVVPVVDTVVILGPDTTGGDAVRFSSGQGCCEGTLFLEHDSSARTVRIRVAENRYDPESQSGALLLEAGAWRQTIGLHDTGAWRDSVVIRHRPTASDSIRQVSVRQGRALAWVSYAGARWLRVRATRTVELTGRSTIEKKLSTTGTPVDVRCVGTITEEFLYEPATGFVDSLVARGALQGRIDYHETTGRVDTVEGTWRAWSVAGVGATTPSSSPTKLSSSAHNSGTWD